MVKRTALEEVVAGCRAILAAAETCLQMEGVALPDARYVSIQGGDWIAGQCEDCCSQLVITPLSEVGQFNDPDGVATAGRDGRQARQRLVSYEINLSAPVNLQVLSNRLSMGTVAWDWDAPANRNSHWSETVPIIAGRWALARNIVTVARDEMCAAGFACRGAYLGEVTAWLEGGCAGTKLTVQVQQ